ncbi:MAG: hypothetical protein OSB05_12095 [Akkermansiaceae bacterium]|nr:hypothetical protein [Akkermansiaceae bacterium]
MPSLTHQFFVFCCYIAPLSIAASDAEREYLFNDQFEDWEWSPILNGMKAEGRKRLAEGKDIGYEYRGPLFRKPVGFELPAGKMVVGAAAYAGTSMFLTEGQAGLHSRYSRKFVPRKKYAYEVALKGKGEFHFRAWVWGQNPDTGATKWHGFPNLITLKLTEDWTVHKGSFSLPEFDESTFLISTPAAAAIVIEKDTQAYIDDFRVFEVKGESPSFFPSPIPPLTPSTVQPQK